MKPSLEKNLLASDQKKGKKPQTKNPKPNQLGSFLFILSSSRSVGFLGAGVAYIIPFPIKHNKMLQLQ